MNARTKQRFLVASVSAAVVLAIVAGAATWQRLRARARMPNRAVDAAVLTAGVVVQEFSQVEGACDVVVDRDPSGSLRVSGRALRVPVRIASVGELKDLLRTLPTPGTGLVRVSYENTDGIRGLFSSPPPDVAAAESQLNKLLNDAGFHPPRSSLKGFLPLKPGQWGVK